jgi:hypothetical protein
MTINSSPNGDAVQLDDRRLLLEFLADKLVRSGNADGALDARSRLQGFQACGYVADTDHTNDHPLLTLNRMNLVPEFADPLAHVVDFYPRCVRPHGNDHRFPVYTTMVKISL